MLLGAQGSTVLGKELHMGHSPVLMTTGFRKRQSKQDSLMNRDIMSSGKEKDRHSRRQEVRERSMGTEQIRII